MEETVLNERKQLIMDFVCDSNYRPMKFREMAGFLQVPKKDREDFKHILDLLLSEGRLTTDSDGRFIRGEAETIKGVFMGNKKGFGFVRVEGMTEDIFIAASNTSTAFNNDIVTVKIIKQAPGRKKEGIITGIVERASETIVGTFSETKNGGFVSPDDNRLARDIYVHKEDAKGAVSGHKVLVKINDFGSDEKSPEGEILRIIGHANDPGVDILSIILAYGIPYEFPQEVMDETEAIPTRVLESEYEGRKDLRDLLTVTIDGEDAKDLDDAVSIEKIGENYILGVHIADVTHYVRENSPLDKEALKRGTSVYMLDRVVPQLPHKLSNGICSLNHGEDRLAMSCIMTIDPKGHVIDHEICESVINVNERMNYSDVKKILEDSDQELIKRYDYLYEKFLLMNEAALLLRGARRKRGAIDFDFPETKIKLDEDGKPIEILPYERNTATRLIEDFMLAANETIAEDFFWREVPFVYRTHEAPDEEKIIRLGIFINNFGFTIKGNTENIHPKEIQSLLDKIQGSEEEMLISRLTLRSMKQAKYTVKNTGHFGLASKYYCHFTSPIRRYPDLIIHRIIKEALHDKLNEKRVKHYEKILPDIALASSLHERRADEAEREAEKLKKAEYMEGFYGQEFDGVISSVTALGLYVELPNTVEGMIKIADLKGDNYYFDEENVRLVGFNNNEYRLGQKVRVKVKSVDRALRTVDFELAEDKTR